MDITTSSTKRTFKKSVFQAHTCVIEDVNQVELLLKSMKSRKPYSEATYMPYACRIEDTTPLEHSSDDGDFGVGDKLLHLLQKWDVLNIFLVVTRIDKSLSGTLLSGNSQRFRVILDTAKDALERSFLETLSSHESAALAKLEALAIKKEVPKPITAAQSAVILAPETVDFPLSHVGTSDGCGVGGTKQGRINNFKSTDENPVPSESPVLLKKESLPPLVSSLDSINVSKSDLATLKALRKPSKELHLVLVCIAIFLKVKDLTWEGCKAMLMSKSFCSRVLSDISPTKVQKSQVRKVRSIITQNPNFTPEFLRRTSVAGSALLQYILNMIEAYDRQTLGLSKKKKREVSNNVIELAPEAPPVTCPSPPLKYKRPIIVDKGRMLN